MDNVFVIKEGNNFVLKLFDLKKKAIFFFVMKNISKNEISNDITVFFFRL